MTYVSDTPSGVVQLWSQIDFSKPAEFIRIEITMALATIDECNSDAQSTAIAPPLPAAEFVALTSQQMSPGQPSKLTLAIPDTEVIDRRWVYLSSTFAALSFLLFQICDMNFCDPDMWHEMSLFRQALVEGWVPSEDRFAYTPTVSPSIHHEWGSGAIFYAVATLFGGTGIIVFKYSLVAAVVGACYWCARQRGASAAIVICMAPAMTLFSSYGFTTIRAQVFTLVLLAVMLCFLEVDQRGRRWWIALWLPLHVIWLNVHAGFVVGAGLMALHACEQILRRRPFWHFVPVGMALVALTLLNPYGLEYLPYLAHGLTMSRPLIVEWNPLWQHDSRVFLIFVLSLLPVGYAIRQLGLRKLTGILVLAASAYAAVRHTRHLSLFCVVWTCYVPGYLQQTKFGTLIDHVFHRYGRLVTQASIVIGLLFVCRSIPAEPWKLTIPSTNADVERGVVCYPVEAVQFLDDVDFHGNLMLPFEVGGYAMWKLYLKAKVSIDGRYEVAYQPGILEEHLRLFQAKEGWQDVLTRYPTDAVIVPCLSRLSSAMPTMTGWNQVYHDGVYEVYTRPKFALSANASRDRIVRASIP